MPISAIIYITIMGVAMIATIILSIYANKKQIERYKKLFTKDLIRKYEDDVKNYLGEDIYYSNYNVDDLYAKFLPGESVSPKLSFKERLFTKAGMLVVEIRGVNKLIETEDEVCEYMMTALLMPYKKISERVKEVSYLTLPKKERIRFIENLADEYHVNFDCAIMRVKSILVLENYI